MSVESSEYVSIGDHDSLKCMICLGFAMNPYQHEECGKLLCTDCKNKLKRCDPCPNCREARPKYFKDRKSELFKHLTTRTYDIIVLPFYNS